jgi:type II secretory pathway pseudopilin PulG
MHTKNCLTTKPDERRAAFTTMEVMVALGLLSLAIVLLAQIVVGQVVGRKQQAARLAALEAAANILESARTLTPDELSPRWAESQHLSAESAEKMLDPTLLVRVEPQPNMSRLKRVTVRISWAPATGRPVGNVELTGYFGARKTSPAGESKP